MSVAVPGPVWQAVHAANSRGDWPPADAEAAAAFVGQAAREGLLPLLFFEPQGLPEAVRAALGAQGALRALFCARAAIVERALGTLAEVLREEPFVVLKGADYAFRLYPQPWLRPMQDIDLLVPRARMDAACARLQAAGLVPRPPRAGPREAPSYYERALLLGDVIVEVHQSFVQRSRARVDYEAVWRRRVPLPALGPSAARLEEADAVAYHALSMAKDEFSLPLVRFLDLWLMLRGRPDLLLAATLRAREWRTARSLFGALHQAARFCPDLARPEVRAQAEGLLGPLARRFLQRFVLPPAREQGRAGVVTRARQLWRKFWLIDGAARRLAFAAEHAAASARAWRTRTAA